MKRLTILAATAAAFVMTGASAPVMAQGSEAADTIDGHPNLNGIWQAVNQANWNLEPHSAGPNPVADGLVGAIGAIPPGLGVVEGGEIPYKPEALERLKKNKENMISHDPEAACYLPGIPRATYMPYPFQIIQGGGDDILMVYEYANANRVIHMGPVGVPPIDTWMGTSYGEWDGDTLVVTTLALSPGDVKLPGGELEPGVTWLDRAGNYLTNTASVVEKFTLNGENHIDYEATIDDPSVYTRPWKIKMPLYRRVEENAQLLEFRCVPFSEHLLYGDLLEGESGSEAAE
ncbi:hypothetical protein FHS61_003031 [Altererythrobacter atlanticus]|uniref:Uncharacterized protein n=1 Tax=Croceibacterium atlanticum TaxID=1267766 RepID=A0A0F7KRH5_9SPHN|nr:hypothetical protein [Croceibacterium atlanticum]AKH42204.1 hypothetical protein WYH_01158 [Croceibacterium atlanticum]MBB5733984.1 hypothetical protein [Croceibacterium atlanticum]